VFQQYEYHDFVQRDISEYHAEFNLLTSWNILIKERKKRRHRKLQDTLEQ
jgi:hypothetical protein